MILQVLATLLLVAGTLSAQDATSFFRYRRSLPVPPAGQVCATVDAAVYAHAAASLKDVRLLARASAGSYEVPYVLTLSEAQPVVSEAARVLNLGRRGDRTVFDLQMPPRTYSDVVLDLSGKDFLGTAEVSGRIAGSGPSTRIGEFTLFDLSSQHLARNTTLHLPESTFRLLHIELRLRAAAGARRGPPIVVKGAAIPASREAQTLYTVATSSADVQQRGRESVAHFRLPARVPIEQVRVVLDNGFASNFSRDVVVRAHTGGASADEVERLTGRVERVRLERDGLTIESKELSFPATLGANLQNDADVEVAVENGDDPPLPMRSVELAMRRRSLCFEARGSELEMFYGDPGLDAPAYDYARTFAPATNVKTVALGEEQRNPGWRTRQDDRVFTERHPHLVYIALLGTVCALALVAFRSGKVHQRR